jgi:hypothetical protein
VPAWPPQESAYIEGEPFPKPHARRLGQRKKLKRHIEVPLSDESRELRELPDPAKVARADNTGEGDVRISDYGGRSLTEPTIPEISLIPDLRLIDLVLWTSQDDRMPRRTRQGPRWHDRAIGRRIPLEEFEPIQFR